MEADEEVLRSDVLPKPIRRLAENVVNRIAAGEVIQRPSSALKELLENSLDAGATVINVILKDGGLKFIQITDNGHGIRYEDLPMLCERHATSKLQEFEDLQTISTLGFRGEALASISFVAHLSVTSMIEGQIHGYRVAYKDGKMDGDPRPCAAVKGTQITVEDLFYNVVARRKAFKNPSEEYSRVMDIICRYAVQKSNVTFSCKKYGERRGDINTFGNGSTIDAIRAVYGASVAKQLIPIAAQEHDSSQKLFQMEGFVSSANYSAKKTTMVLFINDRLVECAPLKRAIEVVYAAVLPKASKPFIYMAITLPSQDVDVNVHPTKREVSFLNQDVLIEGIQKVVEERLMDSNTSRAFLTQTVLPGSCTVPAAEEERTTSPVQGASLTKLTSQKAPNNKAPVNKLVRTDALNPAGRIHAFLHKKPLETGVNEESLIAIRKAVRQRRNPKESAELTSVQELLASIDQQTHGGLLDVVKHCTYVGMADEVLALAQYKTRLYVLNVVSLSKELMYQQVLRRFGHFNVMRLSNPAPLVDLIKLALDEEEHDGRWHVTDGPKHQIAELNARLLTCKAQMLLEYFGFEIDGNGNLCSLPTVLDQYSPDMDRLPQFILSLGNSVDWDHEKECFESFAAGVADFYAMYPPLLPHPSDHEAKFSQMVQSFRFLKESKDGDDEIGSDKFEDEVAELVQEAEKAWAQRDWNIQHVLFPAMKLFLKPPAHMADDGTAIQVLGKLVAVESAWWGTDETQSYEGMRSAASGCGSTSSPLKGSLGFGNTEKF